MRLLPTFLVLFYWLICVTNGAPPRQVGETTSPRTQYTKEEDQFIVKELLKMLDSPIKPHSQAMWKGLAEKHYEKLNQGTTGFRQERTANSLRQHFREVLIQNRPETTVKVPEAIIKKFNAEVSRHPYTKEEDNFIIEELSKPFYAGVFNPSTFEGLRAGHAAKRQARTPGFEHARTAGSIRNHLAAMKHADQFPKEVLEKYYTRRTDLLRENHQLNDGASSSQSTTSNQQTGLQVNTERQHDDWIADMIEELENNTDYELDFSKLE